MPRNFKFNSIVAPDEPADVPPELRLLGLSWRRLRLRHRLCAVERGGGECEFVRLVKFWGFLVSRRSRLMTSVRWSVSLEN